MKNFAIVIGAQKSATTTLYYWLRDNPNININRNIKELDFFSNDEKFEKGKNYYLTEYFDNAQNNLCYVDVSPQYSYELKSIERIAQFGENIKIIYIVRDPIERMMSAFSMLKRRGIETRTFEQAMEDEIKKFNQEGFSKDFSEKNYLYVSLYGHILDAYADYFSLNKIHVIKTSDIAIQAKKEYEMLCAFLKLDFESIPESVGEVFHKGGNIRYPFISNLYDYLKKAIPFRPKFARGIGYWIEQWNIQPKSTSENFNSSLLKELEAIFEIDKSKLNEYL
ncbi:MAG: hypothetical protein ACJA0E_001784 [Bermanella sp.]|jgi:hypothetical protein